MEVVDHYVILGLPSGEEGAKLTEIDIKKAYRLKALELHPDKNRDDPNAHDKFQNLKSSYEILKDEKARKLFDDLLRVKRDQLQRQSQYNVKRRKMMSDLEERERASFAPDHTYKSREEEEEEKIVKKLQEEITRIRAMHAKGPVTPATTAAASEVRTSESANSGEGLDKEKALKVSWEGDSEYYSAQRLREVFGEFGEIEDIVIHFKGSRKKKRGSALVVMTSKDAAVAAMSCVCGDLSNPLLVLPVSEKAPPHFSGAFSAKTYKEPVDSKLNNLVGAKYQAKEDSILEKLRKKAAENKK